MNVFVWLVQSLLAAAFAVAGAQKASLPRERLIRALPWTQDFPTAVVRSIGGAELLAAIGLTVPPLTGVAPVLAPVAATALGLLMVAATVTHLKRDELSAAALNLALLGMAMIVIGARFAPYAT